MGEITFEGDFSEEEAAGPKISEEEQLKSVVDGVRGMLPEEELKTKFDESIETAKRLGFTPKQIASRIFKLFESLTSEEGPEEEPEEELERGPEKA